MRSTLHHEFPLPWTVQERSSCFVVHDKSRQSYCESLTAEKRRVAGNLNSKPPISGAQIRAARALLKWSVRKLSHQSGISQSAITRSERVNGTPSMQVRNLHAIRQVFEEHGIEFLGLDGVRLLAQSPELLPRGGARLRSC